MGHVNGVKSSMTRSLLSVPIVRSVPTGSLSATALFSALKAPFLFEGMPGGWFDGRYSVIGLSPFAVFKSEDKVASFEFAISPDRKRKEVYHTRDPLAVLQRCLNRFRSVPLPTGQHPSLPFAQGGAVGFISYGLIRQYEPVPPHPEEDDSLADIHLLFVNGAVLFDQAQQTIQIVYDPALLTAVGWKEEEANQEGYRKIDALEKTIATIQNPVTHGFQISEIKNRLSKEDYVAMVRRAKEYIAAGDIFQANLSHRFNATFEGPSIFPLYQRLRAINPSPFSAYLNIGPLEIASGSPERLVRVRTTDGERIVDTRPIAGTCPRGKTEEEDTKRIAAMYGSEKERAEHLMLVDLERNDLGKVARYGSVKVDGLMTLERYSHLSHLVSNITGTLRNGVSETDVLRALFPGGTITGVPKVRCMQIIAELEAQARGLYTGSLGYIDFSGELDFNIIIRTFIRRKNELSFQVGAGIVADSDPEMEYQETLQKAAALIRALDAS